MTKARAVMNTCVISVNQDEDIYEAIRMLALNNITGLPVVDENEKLVGIITEKDVLTLLYNLQDKPGTVKEFMTPNVVCFDQEADINDVVESLRTNHFRRVPILDKGRLVGIISRRDIIGYIRDLKHEDQALKDSLLELVF
ncbi:MAG: CBS domain-containing protein [Phycisphaerales bacterium]